MTAAAATGGCTAVPGTEGARLPSARPSLCPSFPFHGSFPACEANACVARVSDLPQFIAYESISRFNAVQMFALGNGFPFPALIPACLRKRWFSQRAEPRGCRGAGTAPPTPGAGMCRIPC